MAQVTYTNLFSEPRNRVVALITSTNVPDPTIGSAEYRKWIYSRAPDVKAIETNGYPLIIVGPVDVDTEREQTSGDGKHKFVNFSIDIEIRTSDRGAGNNDGKGLSNMDSISDKLIQTFMNITNRSSLAINSMELIEPTTGSVETIVENKELIYRRIITLAFRSRLAISA